MISKKYLKIILITIFFSMIIFIRLKRVDVTIESIQTKVYDTTSSRELNEPKITETKEPDKLSIQPEERCVYSAGRDQVYTLDAFNQLDLETLITFKGIGHVTAEAIINDRLINGPLQSFDDLKRIKGIGDKKLANILYELP